MLFFTIAYILQRRGRLAKLHNQGIQAGISEKMIISMEDSGFTFCGIP